MKDSGAVQQLTDYFQSNFSGEVDFDNGPTVEHTNPYVRFSILIGETRPNLDSTWENVTGIVYIQTYVPVGSGNLLGIKLAETVGDIMKYKTIGTIRLTSYAAQNLGSAGTMWSRIDVRIPFFFERLTS